MYTEAKAKQLCRVLRNIDAEQQSAKSDSKAHKDRIDELLDEAKELRIDLESKQTGLFQLEEVQPEEPAMPALAEDSPAELVESEPIKFPPVSEMSDEEVLAACLKVGIEPGELSIDELRKLLQEYLNAQPPVETGPNAPEPPEPIDEGILELPVEPAEKAETTPGIDPYEQGADARMAGRPITENPYEEGSYHGVSWNNGWTEFAPDEEPAEAKS